MIRKLARAVSLFFTALCSAQEVNEAVSADGCEKDIKSSWVKFRHIEGRGVGYKSGYTTLSLFGGWQNDSSFLPFVNLRGHIFDDGLPAGNAGLGFRYLRNGNFCQVFGANLFYDFRRFKHHNFQQVGAGFEVLGSRWDFRANGYVPAGRRHSNYSRWHFDRFEKHHLIIEKKASFSMYGADAEAGAYLVKKNPFYLYAAAGPYYFTKGFGRDAVGGEARLKAALGEMWGLQVSGSYDSLFHSIVQGQISFSIPLGPKQKIKAKSSGCLAACDESKFFKTRMSQEVDRAEIIVLSNRKKHSVAINPITELPYFFWFVDNTSSSAGTYESPFSSLDDAELASNPADVIYVFPGDGTFRNMSSGIILQDDQKLFGSGVAHPLVTTKGPVTIPKLSKTLPSLAIIGATDNIVVELAKNNEVSGFKINLGIFVPGLFAIGVTKINPSASLESLSVTNNQFVNITGGDGFRAIGLLNADGNVTVSDNSFYFDHTNFTVTDDTGIFFSASGVDAQYNFSHNRFQNASFGINGQQDNGSESLTTVATVVQANYFDNCDIGVAMTVSNNIIFGTANFSGEYLQNTFANLTTQFVGNATAFDLLSADTSSATWRLSENRMMSVAPPHNVVVIKSQDSSINCVRFLSNNAPDDVFLFQQAGASIFQLEPPQNNLGMFNEVGTITPISPGACD